MIAEDIIIKPALSEKSTLGVNDKKYVFYVDPRADKTQIKAAVEKAFPRATPPSAKRHMSN